MTIARGAALREWAFPLPLAPLEAGQRVVRARWPWHVTLVTNLRVADRDTDALVATVRAWARRATPPTSVVGADADFGAAGEIPVQLLDSPALHALHVDLLDALRAAVPFEPVLPSTLRAGYRPHLTRVAGAGLEVGTSMRLDTLAIAEIGPGGDRALAEVVETVGLGTID